MTLDSTQVKNQIANLYELAYALWGDSKSAAQAVIDAYSTHFVIDSKSELSFEKATDILFQTYESQSHLNARLADSFFLKREPFFRFASVYLERQARSFAGLALIFKCEPSQLSKKLWEARGSAFGELGLTLHFSQAKNGGCLSVDLESPWMQNYLDRSLSKKEHTVVETHLQKCEHCLSLLTEYRSKRIQLTEAVFKDPFFQNSMQPEVDAIENEVKRTQRLTNRFDRSLFQTLLIFFSRKEVLGVLLVTALYLIWAKIAGAR